MKEEKEFWKVIEKAEKLIEEDVRTTIDKERIRLKNREYWKNSWTNYNTTLTTMIWTNRGDLFIYDGKEGKTGLLWNSKLDWDWNTSLPPS